VRFGDLHVQTAVFLPIDTTGRASVKVETLTIKLVCRQLPFEMAPNTSLLAVSVPHRRSRTGVHHLSPMANIVARSSFPVAYKRIAHRIHGIERDLTFTGIKLDYEERLPIEQPFELYFVAVVLGYFNLSSYRQV